MSNSKRLGVSMSSSSPPANDVCGRKDRGSEIRLRHTRFAFKEVLKHVCRIPYHVCWALHGKRGGVGEYPEQP